MDYHGNGEQNVSESLWTSKQRNIWELPTERACSEFQFLCWQPCKRTSLNSESFVSVLITLLKRTFISLKIVWAATILLENS